MVLEEDNMEADSEKTERTKAGADVEKKRENESQATADDGNYKYG